MNPVFAVGGLWTRLSRSRPAHQRGGRDPVVDPMLDWVLRCEMNNSGFFAQLTYSSKSIPNPRRL